MLNKKGGLLKWGIILAIVILAAYFLIDGTEDINGIKDPDRVGETVKVSGTVKNTIKIGALSGYTLEDETGTIGVSSQSLPEEGTTKTAKGVLMKDTLFGYYIKAN